MNVDVAIIGGGAAGLSAAKEIATRGGKVVIIDDHAEPGGNLRSILYEDNKGNWFKGYDFATKLIQELEDLQVSILCNWQVWAIERGFNVFVSHLYKQEPLTIQAESLLIATGISEIPVALPGWTLPGVLTVGAAQTMTNVYQIKPGKKVVIAGIDLISLRAARAMSLAGVDIVGMYLLPNNEFSKEFADPKETMEKLNTVTNQASSWLVRTGGQLFKSGLKPLSFLSPSQGFKVWDIQLHFRQALHSIEGDSEVRGVKLTNVDANGISTGGLISKEVDTVCLWGGLSPLYELAATIGCQFAYIQGLGGTVPVHNQLLETSVAKVFVAGNITGIEGSVVAMAQGKLAGLGICKRLKLQVKEEELAKVLDELTKERTNIAGQFQRDIFEARNKLQDIWKQNKIIPS